MIIKNDAIVIGSSLLAVLYAFNNELPIFFAQERRPFRFDCLDPELDLSLLKLPAQTKSLTTFGEDKIVGIQKVLLWERLLFLLGLSGKAPLSDRCTTMRINKRSLICSNEYAKIAEIEFKTAYFFGDDKCSGLVTEKEVANEAMICYDWIAFHRGGKHEIDYIETDDSFVKQIWFYPSDRIDGATKVKDACLVSFLSKDDLTNFDHSETMARFKAVSEMEDRGMKGVFNGYSPTGRPKYYKFRTSNIAREKRAQFDTPWEEEDNIKTPRVTEQTLLEDLREAHAAYDRLLRNL
jgi:hypothetical protein